MTLNLEENLPVGIAWYRIDDYPEILSIMADRDQLPTTYSDWRMSAEKLEKKLQREGRLVVRAEIEPGFFRQWCAERRLNVDAHARMRWANEAARRATMPRQ